MTDVYIPPKKWIYEEGNGGKFAGINRPTAGARVNKELPIGDHELQLYSLATPNGQKVTILLEELIELGLDADYDAYLIDISQAEQFQSGFVDINPNSKIPALLDKNNGQPIKLFESGSILVYLAEKFKKFIPNELNSKTQMYNWLFWQVGSAPYLGGGFGHFYAYAPEKFKYPIDRFTMETKRQLDLLDKHLSSHQFFAGKEYSIADMAIFPWYGLLTKGLLYDAAEFLSVSEYKNVIRWTDELLQRPAVKRGLMVNRSWGDENSQVRERHHSHDFDGKEYII